MVLTRPFVELTRRFFCCCVWYSVFRVSERLGVVSCSVWTFIFVWHYFVVFMRSLFIFVFVCSCCRVRILFCVLACCLSLYSSFVSVCFYVELVSYFVLWFVVVVCIFLLCLPALCRVGVLSCSLVCYRSLYFSFVLVCFAIEFVFCFVCWFTLGDCLFLSCFWILT